MKKFKKLQIFVCIILLVTLMFYGCKKEENKIQIVASFSTDKEIGDSPLLVKFTNTSTNAGSYKWDFGDGTTSAEKDPSHSFINASTTSEKIYSVTLTATASDKSNTTISKVITVNKSAVIFNPALQYGSMTDQDGNVYKTIIIGTQTWMAENLRVTRYRNGDSIPNVTSNSVWTGLKTGARCTYGNSVSNDIIEVYGRLYNWYAVADSRGISPEGWHVPTDDEWATLTTFLGGEKVAAGKLKEIETLHWLTTRNVINNESGFTALPSGSRYSIVGTFNELGSITYFWTSTSYDNEHAWNRYLNTGVICYRSYDYKTDGYPVRLIKD